MIWSQSVVVLKTPCECNRKRLRPSHHDHLPKVGRRDQSMITHFRWVSGRSQEVYKTFLYLKQAGCLWSKSDKKTQRIKETDSLSARNSIFPTERFQDPFEKIILSIINSMSCLKTWALFSSPSFDAHFDGISIDHLAFFSWWSWFSLFSLLIQLFASSSHVLREDKFYSNTV